MEDGRLPQVGTHAEFVDALESMIETPRPDDEGAQLGRMRELKSYILEADGGFPSQFESSGLQCRVRDTNLGYINILNVQKSGNACEFFLDKRDPRFFVLHTNARSDYTSDIMKKLAHDPRHAFDYAWFYSDMLQSITEMPGNEFMGFGVSYSDRYLGSEESDCASIENLNLSMSGSMASEMQKMVLENPRISGTCAHNMVRVMRGTASSMRGHMQDEVHNTGYFALKRGKSVSDHLDLVGMCQKKYAETVERVESLRIGWRPKDGESVLVGSPFHFRFKKRVKDLDVFISKMFNSAMPFKLWGIKSTISEGYFKVHAIDLHTGGTIDFEIASDMMRVYLRDGGCGNTILRLLTNLQMYHDAGDTCTQVI